MQRFLHNPVISREQILGKSNFLKDVSSVFNPGGVYYEGRIVLVLRVQNRARETLFVRASSMDGMDFEICSEAINIKHLERCPHRIYHIYDARITASERGYFDILCAMDTDKGCFLGYFRSEDLFELEFITLASEPDVRNGVIFCGTTFRFERPNNYQGADGVKTGSTIVCSRSQDYQKWEYVADVFSGRPHYWDELIGSGPPPIRCDAGWLHIYHGVATHFGSSNIYQVGVSLQDIERPWITLSRGKYNILEPRQSYELMGQVPNVVFPTAAIPISKDGKITAATPLYVYYGAADTCVGLAITSVKELLAAARNET
jgi:beta-1,4-mannooligosaccharide/beta-1,4-mannosyl-N-acetylglucosamine phosphorylase